MILIHPKLLYFTILVLVWYYVFSDDHSDPQQNHETPDLFVADRIIQLGETFLGTPYQFGALAGQTETFDCSSFVQYVFGQNGITLPRTSRQQSLLGITVPRDQIRKGDLLFFKSSSSDGVVRHVGIYAGNDLILNTWGQKGVHYESLSHSLLESMFLFAKRVIGVLPEDDTSLKVVSTT